MSLSYADFGALIIIILLQKPSQLAAQQAALLKIGFHAPRPHHQQSQLNENDMYAELLPVSKIALAKLNWLQLTFLYS